MKNERISRIMDEFHERSGMQKQGKGCQHRVNTLVGRSELI